MRRFLEFMKFSGLVYISLVALRWLLAGLLLMGMTVFGGFKELFDGKNNRQS